MSVEGTCGNDTVLLAWEDSQDVFMYIVTASGDLGYIVDFNTTATSLEVWLPCGQTFSFSVVAQGRQCESPPSGKVDFRTGTAQTLPFNKRLPLYTALKIVLKQHRWDKVSLAGGNRFIITLLLPKVFLTVNLPKFKRSFLKSQNLKL